MPKVFENPAYLRAKIHDMETGEDIAKLQDRWAYVGGDGTTYTHPSEKGATRLADMYGEPVFTLRVEHPHKDIFVVRSSDQGALRMMGEAHHNRVANKPDLTLIDPLGKTIATMDAWAFKWAEVAA